MCSVYTMSVSSDETNPEFLMGENIRRRMGQQKINPDALASSRLDDETNPEFLMGKTIRSRMGEQKINPDALASSRLDNELVQTSGGRRRRRASRKARKSGRKSRRSGRKSMRRRRGGSHPKL